MKRKNILLASAFMLMTQVFNTANAQSSEEKGLSVINKSSAEAIVGFLASDNIDGREAGQKGARVAADFLEAQLMLMGIEPLFDTYRQPFEAYAMERQKRSRFQVHPDSIAKLKLLPAYRAISMTNILGKIEGKKKDEYVIVGAHFDHLGIDPTLSGDQIYNGADDNATGVQAVLQIAKAFLATGEQPERTVIFALWDGEEKGLLGSKYFVQECSFRDNIKGYLNFDMIGRNTNENNPEHVDYFFTEAYPAFGEWLKDDIEEYGLKLKPTYRPWDKPIGGSDNASFAKHDIPVIWYHTNGHKDYHQPSDHTDLLNWEKVVDITKASFLNMWNFANLKSYD